MIYIEDRRFSFQKESYSLGGVLGGAGGGGGEKAEILYYIDAV